MPRRSFWRDGSAGHTMTHIYTYIIKYLATDTISLLNLMLVLYSKNKRNSLLKRDLIQSTNTWKLSSVCQTLS